MTSDQVIAKLLTNERELRQAGIVRLSLFGSAARGDGGLKSDIDLPALFDESRRLSSRFPVSIVIRG